MKPDFAGVRILSLDGYVSPSKRREKADVCIGVAFAESLSLRSSTRSKRSSASRSRLVHSSILLLEQGGCNSQ